MFGPYLRLMWNPAAIGRIMIGSKGLRDFDFAIVRKRERADRKQDIVSTQGGRNRKGEFRNPMKSYKAGEEERVIAQSDL